MLGTGFRNREDAGTQLAQILLDLRGQALVVLALPRGGIPVAKPIAQALSAPLDVVVAKKLGFPDQPELAIGAVTARNHRILNQEILRHVLLPPGYLEAETEKQRRAAAEREKFLRGTLPQASVSGKIAILVDDGIATGMTMRAAIADVRERGAAAVIVAAPVIAPSTYSDLARLADRVVAVAVPDIFYAVGQFYEDFRQVSEEEAARELAGQAASISKPGGPPP